MYSLQKSPSVCMSFTQELFNQPHYRIKRETEWAVAQDPPKKVGLQSVGRYFSL